MYSKCSKHNVWQLLPRPEYGELMGECWSLKNLPIWTRGLRPTSTTIGEVEGDIPHKRKRSHGDAGSFLRGSRGEGSMRPVVRVDLSSCFTNRHDLCRIISRGMDTSPSSPVDRRFRLAGERFYGIFECGGNWSAPISWFRCTRS